MSEFSYGFESLYETTDILYIVISLIYLGMVLTIRLIISDFFDDKYTTIEKTVCYSSAYYFISVIYFYTFPNQRISDFFLFFYITFLYGL